MAVSTVMPAPVALPMSPSQHEAHLGSHPRPALQHHSKSYSVSSSSRPVTNEFRRPILEEGDESASESPNEPATPVNERESREFQKVASNTTSADNSIPTFASVPADGPADGKPSLVVETATPPSGESPARPESPPPSAANQDDVPQTPLQRRTTRSSTTSLKGGILRTMSFFRRSNSQSERLTFAEPEPPQHNGTSDTNLNGSQAKEARRRFSMNRSSTTTRSNSPPSPGSPLEMAVTTKEAAAKPTVPAKIDFEENNKKKNRASTGFGVLFNASGTPKRPKGIKRSSSYQGIKHAAHPPADDKVHAPSKAFAIPAEEGAGMKARRMSLSLPDDFTVDVGHLAEEFEYPNKLLGRHGKHLGKGATSKVIIMSRKSFQGELYAVKEFRPRTSKETQDEYEKKVKSEYSIAKSLHHPNIVETIRLCVDEKGRWNHVMEYCSDGDLYNLVEKKFFTGDAKQGDRLCLFKQLIQGVNYLHSNGIAHRDIKLENLLLTNESKLKITDFGVSEVFSGVHPGLREAGGQCGIRMDGEVRLCKPGICGSGPYISPEVLAKQEDYDPRGLDVWGSAIVMLYLIFGGGLWKNAILTGEKGGEANYVALVRGWEKWAARHPEEDAQITDGDYPFVQAFDVCIKPPVLRRILLQMLNPDPARRISMAAVASQKWIRGIECCQLDSYDDPAKFIDASKKNCLKAGGSKIFCHKHIPTAYDTKVKSTT